MCCLDIISRKSCNLLSSAGSVVVAPVLTVADVASIPVSCASLHLRLRPTEPVHCKSLQRIIPAGPFRHEDGPLRSRTKQGQSPGARDRERERERSTMAVGAGGQGLGQKSKRRAPGTKAQRTCGGAAAKTPQPAGVTKAQRARKGATVKLPCDKSDRRRSRCKRHARGGEDESQPNS